MQHREPEASTSIHKLSNDRALARAAPVLGAASVYCAAAAVLTTALFVYLHHLGNQIPYQLAQERIRTEAAADRTDDGYTENYKIRYEYCEISAAVLAGARTAGDGNAVRNAIAPRTLAAHGCRTFCYMTDAESNGAEQQIGYLKSTHWWGNKALYAIVLRHLTVSQVRDLTLTAIRLAYVLLGIALLLLAPRMFLVGVPLIAFDAVSGIEYWADVANGLPYLWTILFAAALALLMRARMSFSTVLASCFAGGAVSAYMWMGDGHTLLAIVWIGLLAWFRYDHANAGERAARAVSCIAFYTLGVVLSYALALLTKIMVSSFGDVWNDFSISISIRSTDAAQEDYAELLAGVVMQLRSLLEAHYTMAWPSDPNTGAVYSVATVSAALAAVGLAVFRMRQGNADPLWSVLWIVVLMLAHSAPQFLITDHMPYRAARFMFVPHALCWSCLFLAVRTTDWKLSSATLGFLASLTLFASWYLSDRRVIGRLLAAAENTRPVIRSTFDVYWKEDTLIYVKDACRDEDLRSWLFLKIFAVDETDLPGWRISHGFENRAFVLGRNDLRGGFHRYKRQGGYTLRAGGRCVAVRTLPDYEIARVHTGQLGPDGERLWSGMLHWASPAPLIDKLLEGVKDTPPLIDSAFDVYRDGNKIVYAKAECRDEDVRGSFFLHVVPVDESDLPSWRTEFGFDNMDFHFEEHGHVGDGRCAAARVLPDYEIARVDTGQLGTDGELLWSGVFHWTSTARIIDRLLEGVKDTPPLIDSAFDVYRDGNKIVYAKAECRDEDVRGSFFLHVVPVDESDLPSWRTEFGFDNMDFHFEEHGHVGDGRCAAARVLPDYEIARIRTGQLGPDGELLWNGMLRWTSPAHTIDRLLEGVKDTPPFID